MNNAPGSLGICRRRRRWRRGRFGTCAGGRFRGPFRCRASPATWTLRRRRHARSDPRRDTRRCRRGRRLKIGEFIFFGKPRYYGEQMPSPVSPADPGTAAVAFRDVRDILGPTGQPEANVVLDGTEAGVPDPSAVATLVDDRRRIAVRFSPIAKHCYTPVHEVRNVGLRRQRKRRCTMRLDRIDRQLNEPDVRVSDRYGRIPRRGKEMCCRYRRASDVDRVARGRLVKDAMSRGDHPGWSDEIPATPAARVVNAC